MSPEIHTRPGVGSTARIVQRQALRFARVFIDTPILIFITHGEKALSWAGGDCVLHAGEALAIAGGQHFDVTNRVGPDGRYEAFWLVWEPALLAAHVCDAPPIRDVLAIHPLGDAFANACLHARDAIAQPDVVPEGVARHRMAELLVWLAHHGGRFAEAPPPSFVRRVRGLLDAEPGRAWNTDQIAAAMAISEATLRRRLAAEGTALSELLVDVRMTRAMQLLQSTAMPVTRIAEAVGYESASRFALRFRSRFGFAPTAIRGHRRAVAEPV
ncbi:helix-turn-helix transcriptional regulator [Niveibacterium sp.]|uniref:helix-turn-helix transcriptional regulator n=1 Tax=Niveibacterium sp. TaxID=2017444 RepID=UPI0035B4B5E9